MQTESQRVGPITQSERIVFIDVLRGMALFGILAANMRAFFAPMDVYDNIGVLFHSRADVIAQTFIEALIQGKFISIFSFLFGLGFAVQMSRAEARGVRFMGFYPRRLLALALFGVIHGALIWSGDILLTYALSGAILLLFRRRQQKTLLWWAGSLFAVPIVVGTTFLTLYYSRFRPHWMIPKPPDLKKYEAIINIYAHGTVRQIFVQNWVEWKQQLPWTLFGIYAAALFLLGMWVWRAGIVQRLDEYKSTLRRMCAWCLSVGLSMSIFSAVVRAILPHGQVSLWGFFAGVLFLPGSHILGAGYVSALALIFLHEDWRRRLLPFAAVGRMALTNYLMQSALCTLFFYHYTTGLFGRIGPAIGLVPTVVSLCGTGLVQQLVVAAVSLWPHRVVVAWHDLRQDAGDAKRGGGGGKRRAAFAADCTRRARWRATGAASVWRSFLASSVDRDCVDAYLCACSGKMIFSRYSSGSGP